MTTTPTQQQPQSLNRSLNKIVHYSHYNFLHFNLEKGTIFDWNSQQNLLTSEDFIVGLQKGLEHEVGEASGWLMYLIGQEWGTLDAQAFQVWFEKDFNYSIKNANLRFALETWWWPLRSAGWGKWAVDLNSIKDGFLFVDLYDSAVAKTLGNVGKPVCYLYAGLLAGFFSVVFERGLSSTEIQCYSMGNTFCRFLVGSETRIKAAEFWLNSGANAKEIEQRFLAKEFSE